MNHNISIDVKACTSVQWLDNEVMSIIFYTCINDKIDDSLIICKEGKCVDVKV
jgi:hypothetical protein